MEKKSKAVLKTMDINEAGKIVTKAQEEQGERWFDFWNPMNEDLNLIISSLYVIEGYCQNDDDLGSLCAVVQHVTDKAEDVLKKLSEVIDELRKKHRLGPYLPLAEDERVFVLPKVVLERYRLT